MFDQDQEFLMLELTRYDIEEGSIYQMFASQLEMLELPNNFHLEGEDDLESKFVASLQVMRCSNIDVKNFKEIMQNVEKIHGF